MKETTCGIVIVTCGALVLYYLPMILDTLQKIADK